MEKSEQLTNEPVSRLILRLSMPAIFSLLCNSINMAIDRVFISKGVGTLALSAVTVAFGLRNMASYPDALREMGRMLRPGGHLLILDFSLPESLLKSPYRFYLHRILPVIAGWMTGHREAYDYLADSIEAFPCGQAMKALLRECGYSNITAEALNGGIASIYTAQR